MNSRIEFTNLESKTALSLEVDKPFIVVFGRNGSGKTTLSRNAPEKEYVFNTDFIYKNIYVETTAGATDDVSTKESFSELWIGEKIVKLKNELETLKNQKNPLTKEKELLTQTINKTFVEKGITLINYLEIDKRINDIKYVKNDSVSNDEVINSYKATIECKTNINDEEQFKQAFGQYKNNSLVQMFIKAVKRNAFLEHVLFNKDQEEISSLVTSLQRYNNSCDEIKRINLRFTAKDKAKEEEWIRKALELHEDANKCYFCGNENIEKAIIEWKEILSSSLKEETNKTTKYLESIIELSNEILKNKESFNKVASNSILTIEKIVFYLCAAKESMAKNEPIKELKFPLVKSDELVVEENELLKNIQNYLFRPFLSKYEILSLLIKDYDSKCLSKDTELENEMASEAESIKKRINSNLKELDFDKELKIAIEKRGNTKKFRFGFINSTTKINTLSDGQKHKLALAIFFASIEDKDLTEKIVVLDDPIVTLDYRSYYLLKKKILKISKDKNPKSIIVLTYNVDYLYIQLTNLYNSNADFVKLVHLTSKTIKEVDYNIINYDDLSLYQAGIKSVSSYDEFSLVASLNVRIYRMFLDLYLRMKGIPSTNNPKEEIESIMELDEDTKNALLECNKLLEHVCRDTSSTNKDLYDSFVATNEFVQKLGFPVLIDKPSFSLLKKYSNNQKRISSYVGDSLLFLIINRAVSILESTDEKNKQLKDYMNHPRTQLTSSIVGIDFSDL